MLIASWATSSAAGRDRRRREPAQDALLAVRARGGSAACCIAQRRERDARPATATKMSMNREPAERGVGLGAARRRSPKITQDDRRQERRPRASVTRLAEEQLRLGDGEGAQSVVHGSSCGQLASAAGQRDERVVQAGLLDAQVVGDDLGGGRGPTVTARRRFRCRRRRRSDPLRSTRADLRQVGEQPIVERRGRAEPQPLLARRRGRRCPPGVSSATMRPLVDDRDPVGEALGLLHEVGDEQDGDAAVADRPR